MDITKREFKLIALIIIIALISFFIGSAYGATKTLEYAIKKAGNFMNISIDEKQVAYAIKQYEQRINTCYPDRDLNYFLKIE